MYTLEDIYNLPDGQRAELIDGAIYFMAPLNRRHQEILFSLSRKIADYKSPPMVARLLTGLFSFSVSGRQEETRCSVMSLSTIRQRRRKYTV